MLPKTRHLRLSSLLLTLLLLLFFAESLYGLQAPDHKEDVPNPSNSVFLTEEILNQLKTDFSAEKLTKLKNIIKAKGFSPEALTADLAASGFQTTEIHKVWDILQKQVEFVNKTKKIVAKVHSIEKIKAEISEYETKLATSPSEEERQQISEKLNPLAQQLKKLNHDFSESVDLSIADGPAAGQATAILRKSGYQDHEIKIIFDYVQKQAAFQNKKETLSTIVQSITMLKEEVREKEHEYNVAQSNEAKKEISNDINELNKRLKGLENDFTVISAGIDVTTFSKERKKELDLQKSLKEILAPVISEIKEITDHPRKIEMLRNQTLYYDSVILQVEQGLESIDNILLLSKGPKLSKRLQEERNYWHQKLAEIVTKKKAYQHQLAMEESKRVPVSEMARNFFQSFLKHRGKNFLLSILAFLFTYLLFRLLHRKFREISPLHQSPAHMSWANLIDILFYIITFLAAIGAMIFVLYTSGDMLILGVVIIILAGIVWTVRNALPQFLEQIRILFNFGSVRQRERVIYDGIPWEVESIGVFSYLKNPLLTGGTIRFPLKNLLGIISRPSGENEPWFPCKQGDWILINENLRRQVLLQTPQFVKLGCYDMHEIMPTSNFLRQRIMNLSETPFWVGITFYIAYKHRFTVLDEVHEKLVYFIKHEIKKKPYSEHVLDPWIEFAELSESSLGFWVWLRMKPEAAPAYDRIKLDLTQGALKAANVNGWEVLRFTQVQLHTPEAHPVIEE